MLLRQKTKGGSGCKEFIALSLAKKSLLREETLVTVSPYGLPLNNKKLRTKMRSL